MSAVTSGGVRQGRGNVSLACVACQTLALVSADAKNFKCRGCGANNTFFECAHCHAASVSATPHGMPAANWDCQACGSTTQIPHFGRMPVMTARDVQASMELRGVAATGRRDVVLGGFTVVHSTRPSVPAGANCSVGMLEDGVNVRVSDGLSGYVFPYSDLETMEVSGRGSGRPTQAETRGLRLGASAKPQVDTVLRLATPTDVIVVKHPKHTRRELRAAFAEMFARWEAARQPVSSPQEMSFDAAVGELERLTALFERGSISPEEFHSMRAPIVHRLSGRSV